MASDDVNVTFSDGGSTPEIRAPRPYGIVLVADFVADDRLATLTSVDKDSFAAVMASAAPSVAIALKHPLGGAGEIECRLKFDSLRSLQPPALLAQVPGARERLALREKVVDRQRGRIPAEQLESAVRNAAQVDPSFRPLTEILSAAPGQTAAPAARPDGSSLLDMVETPDASARVTADVERLAAAAGDRDARIGAAEGARLRALLERLDADLTLFANALYRHADVRRVERAWRSLKFLVDRIDFREGPRLSALQATRDNVIERFQTQVVDPAFNGDIPTPGLVLFDFPMGSRAPDVALIDGLAQHAASLPVPIVIPLDPSFFNVRSCALIKNLPNLSGLIDGWEYAKWRALRDQDYSKVVMPVLGSFVLRQPHGVDAAPGPQEQFTYREAVGSPSDLLWGGGHLAVGVCAARSYARHGWPTRIFGEAGKIEDLPVVPNPKDPNAPFGPGDATFPDRRVNEFPGIGINLLQSVKGTDHCMLLGGVSMKRPVVTADVDERRAMMEISTPYQMFSSLVAARICEAQPMLHGLSVEQIKANLVLGLRSLMGLSDEDEPDAVVIGASPSPHDPAQTIVAVRLAPPPTIVPGGLHVEMSFAVSAA